MQIQICSTLHATSVFNVSLSISCSRGMQLQQRLQELKERERRAQQHNRQLLLQFERAQETLKEMLACNAAMKTIRVTGCTQPAYKHNNLHCQILKLFLSSTNQSETEQFCCG